jgi:hypothetical protein
LTLRRRVGEIKPELASVAGHQGHGAAGRKAGFKNRQEATALAEGYRGGAEFHFGADPFGRSIAPKWDSAVPTLTEKLGIEWKSSKSLSQVVDYQRA